jgi:hypothetical protein
MNVKLGVGALLGALLAAMLVLQRGPIRRYINIEKM